MLRNLGASATCDFAFQCRLSANNHSTPSPCDAQRPPVERFVEIKTDMRKTMRRRGRRSFRRPRRSICVIRQQLVAPLAARGRGVRVRGASTKKPTAPRSTMPRRCDDARGQEADMKRTAGACSAARART